MEFIADFHIHSRYSRATSKTLDFEKLYIAAQLKGISVVGTGDFTHPGWYSEIKEKLTPEDGGLFRLRPEIERACDQMVPSSCHRDVRFILTTEISNIYKKAEKTRKNHNLVFVPDLDVAETFNNKLDAIGNIKSDGRPILGLDARDLLEIVLQTSDHAFLIPAHIWTPWFSLLGSKSGFDSLTECFEDLTPHIFAVETGLSSDPPMNWRVSSLDGLTLVSNSDAHSPSNLGREANLFHTSLSYQAIKETLETGDSNRFRGTLEFYPEEGKYHYDGHRKCDTCLMPQESIQQGGLCPNCGKPLTLGVLYRVEGLADRPAGEKPDHYHPYFNLIPLAEILSELLGVGPKTKKVSRCYDALLQELGPELSILQNIPEEIIDTAGVPLLGEAIRRMRNGRVNMSPGYDGEYGRITLFKPEERIRLLGQRSLFRIAPPKKEAVPSISSKKTTSILETLSEAGKNETSNKKPVLPKPIQLNDEQKKAVDHPGGPVMVVAGPGTGKTRTLTHRIDYLMREKGISPEHILAVTFTNKAAREMLDRLSRLLGPMSPLPFVGTFHSFCYHTLKELDPDNSPTIIDDEVRILFVKTAIKLALENGVEITEPPRSLLAGIVAAKQQCLGPERPVASFPKPFQTEAVQRVYTHYQELLAIEGTCDYEDLIFILVDRLEQNKDLLSRFRSRYTHIFVDEYQDLNYGQYQLVRQLAPPDADLFVIGDPDQSIYGFRGSDVRYFEAFLSDYPDAAVIHLTQNYRSSKTILDASFQVIQSEKPADAETRASRVYSNIIGTRQIRILSAASEKAEAVAVGRTIERLVGGTGFHSVDFGTVDATIQHGHAGFSDIAVFFRTGTQAAIFADTFDSAGIPQQWANKERLIYRAGIRELLSLIKVLENAGSYMDLERILRVLPYTIGKKAVETLKHWGLKNRFRVSEALWHAKRIPVPDMNRKSQQALYDCIGWLNQSMEIIAPLPVCDRLRHLAENTSIMAMLNQNPSSESAFGRLQGLSEPYGRETKDFLAAMALHSDTDSYDHRAEKVSLMTMHAAKGLEFPIVFIAGCESGYIPFDHADSNPEEERRLFYVAMTRAKDRLYLTNAGKRKIHGQSVKRTVSPFVSEIEEQLRDHQTIQRKPPKKDEQEQLKLF